MDGVGDYAKIDEHNGGLCHVWKTLWLYHGS